MDNASNNDTLVTELNTLLTGWIGIQGRVRCFGHVLSLGARRLMRPFDMKPDELRALVAETLANTETSEDDLTSAGIVDGDGEDTVSACDDDMLTADETENWAAMLEEEREELLGDFQAASSSINKVRTGIQPSVSGTDSSFLHGRDVGTTAAQSLCEHLLGFQIAAAGLTNKVRT
jgi:hypothetical protein